MRSPIECPVCQSSESKSLSRFRGSDVVKCAKCAMIYVPTPVPEITSLYKESYFASDNENHGYQNYRSEFASHILAFTKRLADSEKLLGHRGRLLDMGCALGHCGEAAKRAGWDVYVTDISEYAVTQSRKNFGLNGFISSTEKLPVKPACFDLITLFDVVEHVSHPLDLLKTIKEALSSHGILHITTPDMSSFSARLMGRSWFHFKPNEHLLYFTPQTLKFALERIGYEVIKIKAVPTYMCLKDVLTRLERYSRWGARFINRVAGLLGLGDVRLKLLIGEMQAFARPANIREVTAPRLVKDILDIVCCPNCRSEIQLFEESEAICTQCELSFEVTSGVINFSKYAKHKKRKIIGSS